MTEWCLNSADGNGEVTSLWLVAPQNYKEPTNGRYARPARQQISKGPMGCRPPSFEYSGDAQNECPGANRGNILRSTRLPADELYGFAIADCPDDTVASAGGADQIEGRRG